MYKKISIIILAASLAVASGSSCKRKKDSDPAPQVPVDPGAGDEENITRISLTFTDSANTGVKKTFVLRNPDETNPLIDTIKVSPGKTYLVSVGIFDDTKTPVMDISEEIREESGHHRFHYAYAPETGNASNVNTIITDADENTPALPLGLTFKFVTGILEGTGTFKINLRHFGPDQEKNNDPEGGEQDISVDYPVVIR